MPVKVPGVPQAHPEPVLIWVCPAGHVASAMLSGPLAPPPCKPLPVAVVIPVIVPIPKLEHAQPVPFHWSDCPAAHEVRRLSAGLPDVPPPCKPLPELVMMPVIVPCPMPEAQAQTPL